MFLKNLTFQRICDPEKLYAFLLPTLLCGTSFFIILNYSFGIPKPAWLIAFFLGLIFLTKSYVNKLSFRILSSDILIILIFFFLFFRLKTPFSVQGVEVSKMFFQFCFLPYLFARALKPDFLKYFLLGFAFVAAMIFILTFFNILTLDKTAFLSDRLVVFGIPRQQGLISIIMGALSVLICAYSNRRSSIYQSNSYFIFLIAQCLLVITILILQSRGPLVISLIINVLTLLFSLRVSYFKRILSILVLIAVTLFTIKMLAPNRIELYQQLSQTQSYQMLFASKNQVDCEALGNALAIRTVLFREAIDMFISSPFFGIGTLGFIDASKCIINYGNPHNILLHIASELGIIGLILFSSFSLIPTLRLISLIKSEPNRIEFHLFVYLIVYYVLNFQVAGCSYMECIELYMLFGIATNYLAPPSHTSTSMR